MITKILKYSFYDTIRSYWLLIYFLFFLVSTYTLLYFSSDAGQGMISLLNIVLFVVPLISTVFGTMYYYNSREFIELLLAQPVRRLHVFLGQYIGLSFSLILSFLCGIGVPLLFLGAGEETNAGLIVITGSLLTLIFLALSWLVSACFEDKIKGFGIAILVWLYTALIYDGLFLAFIVYFNDYPLEKPSILFSMLNPVDLSRILILLKLDTSALLGYTGAVFNKFFGTVQGMMVALFSLIAWIIVPLLFFFRKTSRKDF